MWRSAWSEVLSEAAASAAGSTVPSPASKPATPGGVGAGGRAVASPPGATADAVLSAALKAHADLTAGWSGAGAPASLRGDVTAASARNAAAAVADGSPRRFLDSQAAYLRQGDGSAPPSGGTSVAGDGVMPSYLHAYLEGRRGSHVGVDEGGADGGGPITAFGVTVARRAGGGAGGGGGAPAAGTGYMRQAPATPRHGHLIDDTASLASSASAMFPEVYEALPVMDEKTFDIMARANMVANSRIMGYSDPRPDIRPPTALSASRGGFMSPTHVDGRNVSAVTPGMGLQGRAQSLWASQLRPHLHSVSEDPHAARTGEEFHRAWGGAAVAPSDAVSGYAYRHAAAASMLGDGGSVYDRLTDVRGYTGTHRHRFDAATGRGRGLAGRGNTYDYDALVASVPVAAAAGAPALPIMGDFASFTPGAGTK